MTKGPPTFADLIEEAQRTPGTPGRGHDLTNPFGGRAPADHRVVDLGGDGDQVPGAPDFDYEAHVDHFVLPSDKAAYEAVLNSILQAKAVLRYEDRSITKDGDCIVVICYLTYKPSARREGRLRREAEDERRRG
jgi:hypothetical protein